MIITTYGLIVFQLVVWIGTATAKSRKSANEKYGVDMLGFAYPAIPTRHEVSDKLHLHEQGTYSHFISHLRSISPQNLKLLRMRQNNRYA